MHLSLSYICDKKIIIISDRLRMSHIVQPSVWNITNDLWNILTLLEKKPPSFHVFILHPHMLSWSSKFTCVMMQNSLKLWSEKTNSSVALPVFYQLKIFWTRTNNHLNDGNHRSFAVKDEIFCLFEGALDNLGSLKQQYGLGKSANEVVLVIEASFFHLWYLICSKTNWKNKNSLHSSLMRKWL